MNRKKTNAIQNGTQAEWSQIEHAGIHQYEKLKQKILNLRLAWATQQDLVSKLILKKMLD